MRHEPERDTPETDMNEIIQSFMDLPPSRTGRVKIDFARKLERQRDTLKEALEKILDYQGRFGEEDPESIAREALQSLNQNKP
jgi:hypothetical protein